MPRSTRGGTSVFNADNENIIKDVSEAPIERKDAYLKRVAKEKRAEKKNKEKSGSYITMNGFKVLVKYKNANGSEYTRYWFNAKRNPIKIAGIKKDKGCEIEGKFVEFK